MSHVSRGLIAFLLLATFTASSLIYGGPTPHRLGQDSALNLLVRILKHDGVYKGRISLDCVSFITEETTDKYFEFVLRENHTGNCGGDPETSPVVDRYRVSRSSKKVEWLDPTEDKWQPYDAARIRRH